MSNLRDCIRSEIESGNLNDVFTVSQVINLSRVGEEHCVVGGVRYAVVSIKTNLANSSIGPGDRKGEAVKRGQQALFIKHENRGKYSILDDELDEEESVTADDVGCDEQGPVESKKGSDSGKNKIAQEFVEYLRNKPFRILRAKGRSKSWYPTKGPVIGWENRLLAYEWNGKGLQNNQNELQGFIQDLKSIKAIMGIDPSSAMLDQCKDVYDGIIEWGNPKATHRDGQFVYERLRELWGPGPTRVDSTLTKLYAFAEPNDYIIYDSRVATAILSIAEDLYRYRTVKKQRRETVDQVFSRQYPSLGVYSSGAGGTRPRAFRYSGWPEAYMKVPAQLDANDLCRRMVRVLNLNEEDGKSNWTLRDVEAVLFMEGY